MTSEMCETYLYLTLDVLGRTNKNMHLLELPSPAHNILSYNGTLFYYLYNCLKITYGILNVEFLNLRYNTKIFMNFQLQNDLQISRF